MAVDVLDTEDLEDSQEQLQNIEDGYGSKAQLRESRANNAYKQSLARHYLNQATAAHAPAKGVGDRFSTDSVYDKGISIYDLDNGINKWRDSQQSVGMEALNIGIHGAVAFGTGAALMNPWVLGATAAAVGIEAGRNLYAASQGEEEISPVSWLTDNLVTGTLGKLSSAITENTPVYSEAMDNEGLSKYLGTGGLDQLASVIGFQGGAMKGAKMALGLVGEGSKFYKTINDAVKAKSLGMTAEAAGKAGVVGAEEAASIARAAKFTNGVSGLSASALGRFGESVIEAQGTKQEMLDKGFTEDEANQAMSYAFAANMALSSIDYFQNIKMLGTFDNLIKKVGLAPTTAKFGDDAIKYFKKGAENVGKYDRAWNTLKGVGANTITEGGEEGLQYAANIGAQDTVAEGGGWTDFAKNMGKEFGNSFTTEEGQLGWILGGAMGGVMGGVHDFKSYKTPAELKKIHEESKLLQMDVDKNFKIDENGMYTTYKLPDGTTKKVVNKDYLNNINSNGQLEAIKEYAKGKNDKELYDASANKQVLNNALFNLSINDYDGYIAKLKGSKNVSPQELKAMRALQMNTTLDQVEDTTPEDMEAHRRRIDESVALSEDFKKTYDTARELPGFEKLSKKALMKFGNVLATQKAINSQLKELKPELLPALEEYSVQSQYKDYSNAPKTKKGEPDKRTGAYKNAGLATALEGIEDPIERAKLKQDYEKFKELNVANKKLIEETREYVKNPKKLEEEVQEEEFKEFVKEVQKVAKDQQATAKVEEIKAEAANGPVTVETPEGPVEVVNVNGELLNNQTGETVTDEELKGAVVAEQEQQEDAEVIDEEPELDNEEPEAEEERGNLTFVPNEDDVDFSYKKPSVASSSTQVHEIDNGKKKIDGEDGDLFYKFNEKFRELGAYIGKIINSPFVSSVSGGKTSVFTFKAEEGLLDISLATLNSNRSALNRRLGLTGTVLELKMLSEADLQTPEYKTIRTILYKDGKAVPGETNLHYADFFYNTREYQKLVEDVINKKISQEELVAISLQKIAEYNAYRVELVKQIATGQPIFIKTTNKSKGVPNFTPKVNNKQQVNSIKKVFKHLFSHATGMFVDKKEIVGKGVGVVTAVGEDGTSIITFTDGSTVSERRLPKGATVFHTIGSNGEATVLPLTFTEFSTEQLASLAEMIAYKLFTKSNTIRKNGKKYRVIGDKIDRGIVDSLIVISPRERKEKQIFFKKDGTLVVGRKEYTEQSEPKEVKAALMDALLKGNSKVSFKLNAAEDIILPTAIDEQGNITSDEKADSYENMVFGGDTPMIGTNVHHEQPFVNAYYSYAIGPKGYETSYEAAPEVDPNYTNVTVPEPTVSTPTAPTSASTDKDVIALEKERDKEIATYHDLTQLKEDIKDTQFNVDNYTGNPKYKGVMEQQLVTLRAQLAKAEEVIAGIRKQYADKIAALVAQPATQPVETTTKPEPPAITRPLSAIIKEQVAVNGKMITEFTPEERAALDGISPEAHKSRAEWHEVIRGPLTEITDPTDPWYELGWYTKEPPNRLVGSGLAFSGFKTKEELIDAINDYYSKKVDEQVESEQKPQKSTGPTETPNAVAKESIETCKITPNLKGKKFKN